MKNTNITLLIILFLMLGCKSHKETGSPVRVESPFSFFETKTTFEIEVIDFYQNAASCTTEGLPYALLIGKTNTKTLPDTVSVLSYCDTRIFGIGSHIMINPTENPTINATLQPIFFVKDTIIDSTKTRWVIGSEYQSIWGIPKIQ